MWRIATTRTVFSQWMAFVMCTLLMVSCGSGSDAANDTPRNDQLPVNPDDSLIFLSPVYYLHGYVRSDQVGVQLLPVDETFEMQYTEPTFAASSGVLRITGLCHDILIDTNSHDGGLALSNFRDASASTCSSSFFNATLDDISRTVLSLMQSDFVEVNSTAEYLSFRQQNGTLLAFSPRPLRTEDQQLDDELNLSERLWMLESIRTLDSGLEPVPLDMKATLSFGDGMDLRLDLGCSAGAGGAQILSGIISVIDLSFTESICTINSAQENHPVEFIEGFFTRANSRPLAYSLKNDQLTLFNGHDSALIFSGRLLEASELQPAVSLLESGDLTDGGLVTSSVVRRTDIIRDQLSLDSAYTSLSLLYGLTQVVPQTVDFTRYTVIAAFYGYESDAGYDLVVRDAVETDRGLDIYLTSREPDTGIFNPSCVPGPMASAPYSFVLVDSRQTPVTTRIRQTSFCSGLWDVGE